MPPQTIHAFAEKVALVINGSEGVGRAVALQLALQGCYVIVSYQKTSTQIEKTLEELKTLGTLASSFEFTNPENLLKKVENLFGRLDFLINCLNQNEDSQKQIEELTSASLELMKYRPKPTIVNVIYENQEVYFSDFLPSNFRQNCVVSKPQKTIVEHELFSVNNFDDVARVVLFFLSSESKALNKQVLYTN